MKEPRIEKHGEQAEYTEDDGKTWTALPNDSIVSMNMWGFTPSMLTELKNRFPKFLEEIWKESVKIVNTSCLL